MVEEQIKRRGITDKKVLQALASVPRHLFVEQKEQKIAYYDSPLPIGEGQTISQPYVVAFMTEALNLDRKHKVLEIGTGCGYQTAILSLLAKEVISIEYLKRLASSSKRRLAELGYANIYVHQANGYLGWEANAPYDRIICTAAPVAIPENLVSQLLPNGIMVLPVGASLFDQSLYIVKKDSKGKVSIKRSLGVRFVPMVK